MAISSSILQSYLNSQSFYYMKSTKHASKVFGQGESVLYNNQPRLPFQYYVGIRLNDVGTAREFVQQFFDNPTWEQVTPLIKSVDMPSMKIATEHMNQYNRKRLSQTKIEFEPIKMVLHDVVDGKTLKFWDMYYRYYFSDGNEPGKNIRKTPPTDTAGAGRGFINPGMSEANSRYAFDSQSSVDTGFNYRFPTNMVGEKSNTNNIISDVLDNQIFGYNVTTVGQVRYLINSIDIYQVHAGRFNQVTLVNPRIAAFSHDKLDYADGSRVLEITLTFEYEYVYYSVMNMKLGESGSSTEPFVRGEFLDFPNTGFDARIVEVAQATPAPPVSDRINTSLTNLQDPLSTVRSTFPEVSDIRRVSASALDGTIDISPGDLPPSMPPLVVPRSFTSDAAQRIGTAVADQVQSYASDVASQTQSFIDVNRIRNW